jgi:2'-5' RNA ligase
VERFEFRYGSAPWPAGVSALQIYAPLNLAQNSVLAGLLPRWRAALTGAPVALVPDDQLHITLDMVTDAPAGDIPAHERAQLVDVLAAVAAGRPAYRGHAGGALAYTSGAVVDVSPAEPLRQLHLVLRRAIHAVRGPDSTGYRVPKAHISIAYAKAAADSDRYQSRLRQVDPNGAPLHLDEVQLVEVGVDQAAGQLRWTTVASFPLAKPAADASAR